MNGGIKTKLARLGFKLGQHKPQILFGLGAIAVVGGVVLCCRATLKMDDILDCHDKELADLENEKTAGDDSEESKNEYLKNKLVVQAHLVGDILVAYGPGVLCLTTGVACFALGQTILERRNAALLAAYGALEESFRRYRNTVRDIWGSDIEKTILTAADGDVKLEPRKSEFEYTAHMNSDFGEGAYEGGSPYSRRFCPETTHQAVTDMSRNLYTLKSLQKYANDMCAINGHVFLNEVYDWLGFKRTPAGAVTGWLYNPDDPIEHISFGIFSDEGNPHGLTPASFYAEEPLAILLDFNVDGEIYSKI